MTDHPFPDIEQRRTGYNFDAEDLAELASGALELPFMAADVPDRELIDPRDIIPIVNQGSIGSCVGNSGCYCLEWNNWLAGGEFKQFSRNFAYITAQKYSSPAWVGHDVGAAVIGMERAREEVGTCLEITQPYPRVYDPHLSQAAYAEAALHKGGGRTIPRSYNDAYTHLKALNGAIQIGTDLVQSIDLNRTGVIETFSGSSRGKHAMCWIELSPRLDSQGRNYFWGPNSWGLGWGKNGWAEWAPVVVDRILRTQTAVGYLMFQVFDPDQIDWSLRSIKNPNIRRAA